MRLDWQLSRYGGLGFNGRTIQQDAQKVRPARPQAEQVQEAYPQGYVEDSCELRTPLADFFSILPESSLAAVHHRQLARDFCFLLDA